MSAAMTDPRPRVTNRIGNAQHTSVVTALVSPTTALRRSRRISLLSFTRTRHALPPGSLPGRDTKPVFAKRAGPKGEGVWEPARLAEGRGRAIPAAPARERERRRLERPAAPSRST